MKLLLAVLSAVVLHVQSNEINIKDFNGNAEIGYVSPRYEPLTERDEKGSANARIFAEVLRREFPYGLSRNMPPLDPYKRARMSPIVIPVTDMFIINGTISLSNLVKTGAKNFVLHELEVRLSNDPRTDFVVGVSSLNVEVDFDAHIQLSDIVIHQKGHASLDVSGAKYTGAVGAVPSGLIGNPFEVYNITGVNLNVHADEVKVLLTPHVPNGRRSDSDSMDDIIKKLEDHVALAIAQTAMDQTSEVFSHYTVEQVLALIDVI